MFVQYNPNPLSNRAGDCVVRAVTKILGIDWDEAYLGIVMQGYTSKDMPSVNHVWGEYLQRKGFKRYVIPNTCPECYTVADFANEHKKGQFILATGAHVVAVVDGDYYDTWDSGDEVPVYYFERGEEEWQGSDKTSQTAVQHKQRQTP